MIKILQSKPLRVRKKIFTAAIVCAIILVIPIWLLSVFYTIKQSSKSVLSKDKKEQIQNLEILAKDMRDGLKKLKESAENFNSSLQPQNKLKLPQSQEAEMRD